MILIFYSINIYESSNLALVLTELDRSRPSPPDTENGQLKFNPYILVKSSNRPLLEL